MKYQNDAVFGYNLGSLPEEPLTELEHLSEKAAIEGAVLLKNKGGLLPFKKDQKIAVFGRVAGQYYKSGTGSGGLVNVKYVTDILSSLKKDGTVIVDKTVDEIYADWIAEHPFDNGAGWAKEPWCQEEMPLDATVATEAALRNDAALVVIGRTAGEDKDNSPAAGSYLLTETEEDLLQKVSDAFKHVAVVLNVGNVIDMKFVEKYHIDAVLYVWQGGMCGGDAAAALLTGKANPSGKLADTIVEDIGDYPSMKDFGNDERLVYTDDIYVGYRYFETFSQKSVVYPFGFGLSYTEFSVKCDFSFENDAYTVVANVKNVGEVAGKEVVEVYVGAPLGKLGKPARVLVGFVKTSLLNPGESETLYIPFDNKRFASYDDSGVTGHKSAFVLEEGKYNVFAGTDVRSAKKVGTFSLDLTVVEQLEESLAPVLPFDRMVNDDGKIAYEAAPLRTYDMNERRLARKPQDLPYTGDRGYKLKDVKDGKVSMRDFLAQLSNEDFACLVRGEGMSSPKVTPGTGSCFGAMTDSLIAFGIPIACTTDGPSGIRMDSGAKATSMPNGTCLACSFNLDLVRKLYHIEGVEMTAYKIDILLAPGINIHRTPLNGRNFEYFSEDPLLTGLMAKSVSEGVNAVGVACTIKHFMANNQEHKRHDYDAVVSERAIREIYAKPFEIAIREGNARAVMTSYNIVNGLHASTCYDLTTSILRDQWGFDGLVMTDWYAKTTALDGSISKGNLAEMIMAQNDVYMCVISSKNNNDNLVAMLDNGTLTRGEIARCAENLLNHLLVTHAYERFAEAGYTYDVHDVDLSAKTPVLTLKDVPVNTASEVTLENPARYIVEIEISSPMSDLAQIPVTMVVSDRDGATFGAHGTNGKREKFAAQSFLLKRCTILFRTNADVTIHEVKIFEI